MAFELLKRQKTPHLYRHDIESLFYIMLLTCGRYTFVEEKINNKPTQKMVLRMERRLYETWFNEQDYAILGNQKFGFLRENAKVEPIELSQPFEGFRKWLGDIRYCLWEGFNSKYARDGGTPPDWMVRKAGKSLGRVGPALAPLDDETLDGYVSYSSIINPIYDLKGDLEGLVVRYDPDL